MTAPWKKTLISVVNPENIPPGAKSLYRQTYSRQVKTNGTLPVQDAATGNPQDIGFWGVSQADC
jgi:hypothetical protein